MAPSGPFDVEGFLLGVERLRATFDVVYRADIVAREGYLAGDDSRRAAELVEALEDDSVDAIVCARGGYGAMRILDRVGVERVRRARKRLVGFSDVTALHALWARAGVPSLHATMVATLGRADADTEARLVGALCGPVPFPPPGGRTMRPGVAQGLLVGGNLAIVTALLGTPYALELAGRVLFLEDVGERPYRIDRMLTQLRLAGAFAELAGVVLGTFTDCEPGPDGRTVDDVLDDALADSPFPVVRGVEAGHGAPNHPLELGVPVTLVAEPEAGGTTRV